MNLNSALQEFTFNRIEDILMNQENSLIQEFSTELDCSIEKLGIKKEDREELKLVIFDLMDTQYHLIYKLALADIFSHIERNKLGDFLRLMDSDSALEDFTYNQVEILLSQDNKIMKSFYNELNKNLVRLEIDINNCDQLKLAFFKLIDIHSQLIYKQALVDGASFILSIRETKDLLGVPE